MSIFSFLKKQFVLSWKQLRKTQTLTLVGVFLAIEVILGSFGSLHLTESLWISLSHLALAPTAMLFGPVVAGIQGALRDILSYLIRPSGPYFPGFTLSAMLSGVIYGMMLYQTKHKLWQIVIARTLVVLLLNILLNSVFLAMLYGPAKWATLPLRAAKSLIQLPIDFVLLIAVCRTVSRIPITHGYR